MSLMAGIILGYGIFQQQIKQMYRTLEQQFILPGNAYLLMFLLVVFFSHYLLAILITEYPRPLWNIANIIVNGLTSGVLGYRAASIFIEKIALKRKTQQS